MSVLIWRKQSCTSANSAQKLLRITLHYLNVKFAELWKCLLASVSTYSPWCNGYCYWRTSSNEVWRQVLRRFKSCLRIRSIAYFFFLRNLHKIFQKKTSIKYLSLTCKVLIETYQKCFFQYFWITPQSIDLV